MKLSHSPKRPLRFDRPPLSEWWLILSIIIGLASLIHIYGWDRFWKLLW